MSKELHYIISAFLLLIAFTALFLFVKRIPLDQADESSVTSAATIDTDMNTPSPVANAKGRALFNSKCASCHNIFKTGTGPALAGLESRHKWADRNEIYKWIKNPAAYMKNDMYTQDLKKQYGSMMTAFSDLTNEEIDAVMEYILEAGKNTRGIPVASN